MELLVNGQKMQTDADKDTPLLWVLRDHLGLVGTKFGCGMAQCGACTVHIDGVPTRSCVLPAHLAEGKQVRTIEGIADKDTLHPVQQAWAELSVPQCGYCQSGQIMTTVALLKAKPKPTDSDIDTALAGNLCRCGTYGRIRKAVHRAADIAAEAK